MARSKNPQLKLRESDLNPVDKMDVDAGMRIFSNDVIEAVTHKGTKEFLKLIKSLIDAFEDTSLSILQKIRLVCTRF